MESLGIFAKFPQAGKVKSRLGQSIGFQESAELYSCFIKDIVNRFQNLADKRSLCYAPNTTDSANWFKNLAKNDFHLWVQPEKDLGSRMISFILNEFENQASKVIIIGTDSPSLPVKFIKEAFTKLDQSDVVIGPATDGGFYLIGFSTPQNLEFSTINWSSSSVLEETVEKVFQKGLSLSLLSPWYDIDTIDDLQLLHGHLKAFLLTTNHPELKFTMPELETLLNKIKNQENRDK